MNSSARLTITKVVLYGDGLEDMAGDLPTFPDDMAGEWEVDFRGLCCCDLAG